MLGVLLYKMKVITVQGFRLHKVLYCTQSYLPSRSLYCHIGLFVCINESFVSLNLLSLNLVSHSTSCLTESTVSLNLLPYLDYCLIELSISFNIFNFLVMSLSHGVVSKCHKLVSTVRPFLARCILTKTCFDVC